LEKMYSCRYIYNIIKIYIRLNVVSKTVQILYISLIVVSNTVQTDIYIRLIVVSNTVQTGIYIKDAVERRDY
jgi:hypothetical protein